MLVAGLSAKSDNSLSHLLGAGYMNMYLNLEQQNTPTNDSPVENSQPTEEHSNEISNEILENKIIFRHIDDSDSFSDEDDYYDERVHKAMHDHEVDCPTCFVDMDDDDEGILHEYGHHHGHHGGYGHGRHGLHGHDRHTLGARKEDVGEAIISDGPIHSGEGHHGFGHETYRSIDFHDIFRRPSRHHYETRDHHRHLDHEDEHVDEHEDEHDDEHDDEHEEIVEIGGHEHVHGHGHEEVVGHEHWHGHGHEEVEIDGIPEDNAQPAKPAKATKGKKGAQADPSLGFEIDPLLSPGYD